ncbi:MAG: hypothetical protein GWN31_11500, partial [Candidatus Thorarchaeota archaeon]|nr:hypothetical protein [Candidatus Thorarchaeota archaeon]
KSKVTQNALFKCLKNKIPFIPDERDSNRTTHTIRDAILIFFSAFFLHSKSLDSHFELLNSAKGCSNKSLFGIKALPSANQIRNLIDPIETVHFCDVQDSIVYNMQRSGVLQQFKPSKSKWGYLISIDGFEFFRSKNLSCPACNKAEHKDDTIDYFHRALLAGFVHPTEDIFLPFSQDFIMRQDGSTKEDCERNSAKRWAEDFRRRHPQMRGTILADALHANQPFLELLPQNRLNFLIACKPGSNPYMFEWIDTLREGGDLKTFTKKYRKGKYWYESTYEYANGVPIRDSNDALKVSFVMETIRLAGTDEVVGRHSFITNFTLENDQEAEEAACFGRKRWKSENEGHNTLKNQGYNINHNYGHGKENLANNAVVLCLIAMMMHVILAFVKQEGFGLLRQIFSTLHACMESIRSVFRIVGCRTELGKVFITVLEKGSIPLRIVRVLLMIRASVPLTFERCL